MNYVATGQRTDCASHFKNLSVLLKLFPVHSLLVLFGCDSFYGEWFPEVVAKKQSLRQSSAVVMSDM